MGIYLDRIDKIARLAWLKEHATEVSIEEWSWEKRPEYQTPLCLIGEPFLPVLICWYRAEMERALPRCGYDERPRRYFFAPNEKVFALLEPSMRNAIIADVASGYVLDSVELWEKE